MDFIEVLPKIQVVSFFSGSSVYLCSYIMCANNCLFVQLSFAIPLLEKLQQRKMGKASLPQV